MDSKNTRNPNEGSVAAMIKWFAASREISGNEYDFLREELACKINSREVLAWGCKGNHVIIAVDGGRFLVEPRIVRGCEILNFTYVTDTAYTRYDFWYNKSSMADCIKKALLPEKRLSMDWLFINFFKKTDRV